MSSSFTRVGRIGGGIPKDFATALAPANGPRNRIVHDYARLDHSMVLRSVGLARARFPEYLESAEHNLDRVGDS